jgi:hypothetical protein
MSCNDPYENFDGDWEDEDNEDLIDEDEDDDYVEENPCDNCDGHITCLECPYY